MEEETHQIYFKSIAELRDLRDKLLLLQSEILNRPLTETDRAVIKTEMLCQPGLMWIEMLKEKARLENQGFFATLQDCKPIMKYFTYPDERVFKPQNHRNKIC